MTFFLSDLLRTQKEQDITIKYLDVIKACVDLAVNLVFGILSSLLKSLDLLVGLLTKKQF